jgi:hypothetical protein
MTESEFWAGKCMLLLRHYWAPSKRSNNVSKAALTIIALQELKLPGYRG